VQAGVSGRGRPFGRPGASIAVKLKIVVVILHFDEKIMVKIVS
jgi:hypothetical protein